jgi:hypothetical protein
MKAAIIDESGMKGTGVDAMQAVVQIGGAGTGSVAARFLAL